MSDFRARLSTLMEKHHLNQKQAARLAKVSTSTMNSWMAGAAPRKFRPVKALCDHFGVSFCWMMTGEHEVPSLEGTFELETVFEGYAKIKIESVKPRQRVDSPLSRGVGGEDS